MDFIKNMLAEAEKNSTKLSNQTQEDIILERDEHGNLCSYDKNGNKVGQVFEHGSSRIAKTFSEILRKDDE